MDSSISYRKQDIFLNGRDDTETSSCNIVSYTPVVLSFIIALIGLAGNATVLWLLCFRVHRNAFSVYILNLAGANFLFLCSGILDYLEVIIGLFHPMKINISSSFLYSLYIFAYLAGVSILTAISAEHWLSVIWPIWYQRGRPKQTSAVICTLLWALSLLLSILEWQGCIHLLNIHNADWCVKLKIIILVWLFVLFFILSRSNQAMLVRIFCGSQKTPVTRLYVTIVLTVVVFLICGLPFGISVFLLKWTEDVDSIVHCESFWGIILLLSSVSSCANPVICLLVGSIRHCQCQCGDLRLLLERALQDSPEKESEGHEESTTL
ncbi:mas-related G-protein coupled receptor member B8-like [Acomys russatus]|uniref:mas-related G-protein coupled receptor member B8-like n=1 Tax=Acomys russatus TaxID=60746 RepID=UPI0021E2642F|nr:mas-related G-protein coupled receptor member B8-like [Acomys russatus]